MENPQILIIASDAGLEVEFEAALGGIKKWSPIAHFADDIRQGIEAARNRRPEIVVIEMQRDLEALKRLAEDVSTASPESLIVATYRRELFGPDDNEGAILIAAMRSRVADFLRRPLSSSEVQQLLDRAFQTAPRHQKDLGRVLSFVSNKGGAGKSTVSVNTAVALAQNHPDEVLLIDVSLQLGVAAMMLDINPKTTIVDAIQESHRLDETLFRQITVPTPLGLHILAAPPDAVEASHVDEDGFSRILSLARRSYKYVVVDTYPMLDGVIMASLDLSDLVFTIFHATVPSVHGTAHFVNVLRKVGVSEGRLRIVLNYTFPNVPGRLRVDDVVDRLGRDVDFVFPYNKRILTALNTGRPYALTAGKRMGWGRVLNRVVKEIEGMPEPGPMRAGRAQPLLGTSFVPEVST